MSAESVSVTSRICWRPPAEAAASIGALIAKGPAIFNDELPARQQWYLDEDHGIVEFTTRMPSNEAYAIGEIHMMHVRAWMDQLPGAELVDRRDFPASNPLPRS